MSGRLASTKSPAITITAVAYLLMVASVGAQDRRPVAENRAVQTAIQVLTLEIEAHLDDPASPVRTKCDYFVERPAPDITPDDVLVALERADDVDLRVRAYVDWQLLSALPPPVDGELAPRLMQLYRDAPLPFARPGIGEDERRAYDRRLQRVRGEEDAEALDAELKETIEAIEQDNRHLLAYRDELFRRLPDSVEKWSLGLEDAWQRAEAGAEMGRHLRAVIKGIEAWDILADRADVAAMRDVVADLRDRQPPTYFTSVGWSEGSRRASVRSRRQNLNASRQLDKLIEQLTERIEQPEEQEMRFRKRG